MVTQTTTKLANGEHFMMKAERPDLKNIFAQGAWLNDNPFPWLHILHQDQRVGGSLSMDNQRPEVWGKRDADLPDKEWNPHEQRLTNEHENLGGFPRWIGASYVAVKRQIFSHETLIAEENILKEQLQKAM